MKFGALVRSTIAAAVILLVACLPALADSSISFDGVDDVVNVPGFGAIVPTNTLTIEFWQKATSTAAQLSFVLNADTISNRLAAAVPFSDGNIYWDCGRAGVATNLANSGRLVVTPPVSPVGAWHHYA